MSTASTVDVQFSTGRRSTVDASGLTFSSRPVNHNKQTVIVSCLKRSHFSHCAWLPGIKRELNLPTHSHRFQIVEFFIKKLANTLPLKFSTQNLPSVLTRVKDLSRGGLCNTKTSTILPFFSNILTYI